MGATLSSHGLADPNLRALITEYTSHSLRTVEECWRIFVDEANSERFLSYKQFDEVFGMLMQDTEPHFQLFEQITDGKTGVNGYEVLLGVCLALRVDLKRKLHVMFRMYVSPNHENYIDSNMKLVIYRDFLNAITRMLRLSEPPSTEITNAMEVTLRGTEDTKPYVTLKEAIEYSLTHPHVCAFFESLDHLFTGLVTVDKVMNFFQNAELLDDDACFSVASTPSEAAKDPEVLWATKIRDVGHQTFCNQDVFYFPEDLQCFLALKEMQLRKQPYALVFERNRVTKTGDKVFIGLVDNETFARCLLLVLPPIEVNCKSTGSYMVNVAKVSDGELAKMEPQISDAGRKFASMTLRDVLKLTQEANDFVEDMKPKLALRMAYADDYLFNLVHRFASFDTYVPIAHSPKHPFPVVGVLTPFDVVRFMLEDLSLLNGKQYWPVAKLDCFFKPLSMHRATSSMYEAFHLLRTKHMSGILLVNDNDEGYSTFSWSEILELVESWPSKLNFVANISFPVNLPAAITPTVSLPHFSNLVFPIVHVLKNKPAVTILPSNSVAKALSMFYTHRVTRLYVMEEGKSNEIGVLRLADMMRLLLEEQKHEGPRDNQASQPQSYST
ncbi:Aste57867_24814 [Aphanomyces stellatus]|uniref:Aste57867_24814 protein n=1 Tax=Aphanomyces stellatus TaxID=120398 RepID=A0A485LS31_9STRA|nr:hypothetical protein As57867_024736 [Aphanomyces stellatus]VFU01449.1 Aste57867_24814 [Aphanomyces stellatus]